MLHFNYKHASNDAIERMKLRTTGYFNFTKIQNKKNTLILLFAQNII